MCDLDKRKIVVWGFNGTKVANSVSLHFASKGVCLEQGIITSSTKQRIEELDAALEVAEGKVLIERSKDKIQITHADIKKFIR